MESGYQARTREGNATQDNVRLKRIKDRAKGVRFALGYGFFSVFEKGRKWSRHCEIGAYLRR